MTTFADMVIKPNAPDPKTEGVTGSAKSPRYWQGALGHNAGFNLGCNP